MSAEFIASIQEVAMLAAFRTTAFGTSRRDKVASEQVEQDAGALKGAARVNVNILAGADDLHQRIMELQRGLRTKFGQLTSHWDVEGWRLLPNVLFMELAKHTKEAKDEMAVLKAQLRVDAPNILARASQNLGDFAARVKMPQPDELCEAYSIEVEYQPIPDGSKFVGMDPRVQKFLATKLEQSVKAKAAGAMRDPMLKLMEQLASFVERMELANKREDTPEAERKTRAGFFRDATVANLTATTEMLGHFNLTGDPVFAAIIQRMTAMLDGVTPDGLRQDRQAREAAQARAAEVLKMVQGYTAGA